jgi:hypothetical protein
MSSDVEFLARALCRTERLDPDEMSRGVIAWVHKRTQARALLAELRTMRPAMDMLLDGAAVVAPLDVEDPDEPMSWPEWLVALELVPTERQETKP